jgi:hypothetical protein
MATSSRQALWLAPLAAWPAVALGFSASHRWRHAASMVAIVCSIANLLISWLMFRYSKRFAR